MRVSKGCGSIVRLLSKESELQPITKVAKYSQESVPVHTLIRLSKYRTQKNKICTYHIRHVQKDFRHVQKVLNLKLYIYTGIQPLKPSKKLDYQIKWQGHLTKNKRIGTSIFSGKKLWMS